MGNLFGHEHEILGLFLCLCLVSNEGMHFILLLHSYVARLIPRPRLDEPLRSFQSTGKPSSNLTRNFKHCCKYTSTLRAIQQPFPLKRCSLRQSCALIDNIVLAGGLCGFCLFIHRLSFLLNVLCFLCS